MNHEEGFMNIETPEGMAAAQAWTRKLLDTISSNAMWGVPRSSAMYCIDKHNTRLTRCGENKDESIERVFAAMGWTVATAASPEELEATFEDAAEGQAMDMHDAIDADIVIGVIGGEITEDEPDARFTDAKTSEAMADTAESLSTELRLWLLARGLKFFFGPVEDLLQAVDWSKSDRRWLLDYMQRRDAFLASQSKPPLH